MLDMMSHDLTQTLAAAGRHLLAAGYHFITPTPASHARVNARPGSEAARDLRGVFGWSRPYHPGLVDPALESLLDQAGLLECGALNRSLVRFSSLDGLLFAHSAYPTTAADAVFFGPDTYRFARAIQRELHRPVRRAVDIGCGAGPGAVLIARAWPDADVFGVDINPRALAFTAANATLAGVRVTAALSNLLTGVPGEFDLIVANPPYLVDPLARAYRHGGGDLGAQLSLDILAAGLDRLAPGGTLLLYTGAANIDGADPFRAAAQSMLSGVDWTYQEVDPDVFGEELDGGAYAHADRIAAVVLTARKH